MKFQAVLVLAVVMLSCSGQQKSKVTTKAKTSNRIEKQNFQKLLDENNVSGAILIFDAKEQQYYSNNFTKAEEFSLPASTYKIPHSIIGLETGILENENSIFQWNGEDRAMEAWESDLTLQQAFQRSCVPCYQELARKIGVERMNSYLQKLNFGEMDVNSETLDRFWLVGTSKISPFQQIDFLQRLYNEELPITKTTFMILKNIMKLKETNRYSLSGKTGLAVAEEKMTGWFVGFVEVENNTVFFATKIIPKQKIQRREFIKLRKTITEKALQELKIM